MRDIENDDFWKKVNDQIAALDEDDEALPTVSREHRNSLAFDRQPTKETQ